MTRDGGKACDVGDSGRVHTVISPGTHTKLGFHIALFKFILIGYHRPGLGSRVFHHQSIQNPMTLMESGEMVD